MMRLLSLFTGGKDSTLSVELAREAGHEIALLVTVRSLERDSWMFHTSCVGIQHLQAEAMGIDHEYIDVSGRKEIEVQELYTVLKGLVKEYGVDGLLTGGLASQYQKSRVEWLAKNLSIQHIAPCWGMEPGEVMRTVLKRGYVVLMVAVSAYGLGPEWLGRRLDSKAVEELIGLSERYGFNLAGEGGEYETLVQDTPFFRYTLRVEAEPVWLGDRGYLRLKEASLTSKIP